MGLRLVLALILVAVTLAWVGSASAVSISFIEPDSETANILVSADISGTIVTSPELASLTVGSTGNPRLVEPKTLALVALTQPGSMHMEGGGQGVSDLLLLRQFFGESAGLIVPVGFQVLFRSDGETGLPNPGDLTAVLVETGQEQLLLSGTFFLPPLGPVDLTVTGRSDLEPVPEPATLFLLGTTMTGLGLAGWRRRRQA